MAVGRVILPDGTIRELQIPSRKRAMPLAGRWRITWMEQWSQDAVDLVAPGELVIGEDGQGSMSFIAVACDLDIEPTERDGRAAVEWSWVGEDEGDEQTGRGWATLQDDGSLRGRIFFFRGDASDFTATKRKR